MCRIERWSVRTLQKKIDGMLFERTALSKKPDQLIRQEIDALREEDKLTPDLVFRDPYLLGFLGLRDTLAEKDLEAAILREMEGSSSNWASASRFSNGRNGSRSVAGQILYMTLLGHFNSLRELGGAGGLSKTKLAAGSPGTAAASASARPFGYS